MKVSHLSPSIVLILSFSIPRFGGSSLVYLSQAQQGMKDTWRQGVKSLVLSKYVLRTAHRSIDDRRMTTPDILSRKHQHRYSPEYPHPIDINTIRPPFTKPESQISISNSNSITRAKSRLPFKKPRPYLKRAVPSSCVSCVSCNSIDLFGVSHLHMLKNAVTCRPFHYRASALEEPNLPPRSNRASTPSSTSPQNAIHARLD